MSNPTKQRSMATAENTEMSKRDRHIGRLREKHPDKKFEDDEEIYGQIGDDYDEYERRIGEYEDRQRALGDMFATDPRSAQFLTELSKGENAVTSILKHYGTDIKEALEDPEVMQQVADAHAAEIERLAKNKQLDDEYAANMEKSLADIRQYQEEHGLTDEETDAIFFGLISIVRDGVMGKFSPERLDMMSKAINHDKDVAAAGEEGIVTGKNQRVTEKLRKSNKGDGLAQLNGKNGQGSRRKGGSIFDLASEAM